MIRFVPTSRDTIPDAPVAPVPLSAARVAVSRDPQTARPTLVVLPPGASPPANSAVAMLIGASPDDMLLLADLLEDAVLTG